MTTKYESRQRASAREKSTRLADAAKQHAAALEQLRVEQEAADAELKAADQHDAEVLAYANQQGLPPDIAEKEIEHRRGNAPQDALQMSPDQWVAHRRALGL